MPVEIQKLTTTVDVVDASALLTPEVLAQVVEAVLQRMRQREQADRMRASERKVESVVQQQRARTGG